MRGFIMEAFEGLPPDIVLVMPPRRPRQGLEKWYSAKADRFKKQGG